MDEPQWGANLSTGEITRPAPETTPGDTDATFNAFDDEPAGTDPAAAPPPAPPAAAPDVVPRYRYDTVNSRFQESQAREQRLLTLLERLSATPAGAGALGPPASPADAAREKIRQQLFEVVPEFKEFLALRDQLPTLLSAAKEVPQLRQENQEYWGRVADANLAQLRTTLGERLGIKLDPQSALSTTATKAFFQYVAADPSRVQRYESRDGSVLTEFLDRFDQELLGPLRTRQQATTRVEQVRRLPVAGRTSPPPAAPIPKPDPENEDAVFQTAWDVVQNARRATTP